MKNLLKAILRTLILILLILGLCCGLMIIIMPIVTITICGICYISNTFKITNTEWLMIIIIPLIIVLIYGNYKCIKQEQKEKGDKIMKIKILPLDKIIEPDIIHISGDKSNFDIAFWCKGHYYGVDDIEILEGKQKIKKINKIIKKLYKTKMKFNFYINIETDSI